jgi:hypothetical protein
MNQPFVYGRPAPNLHGGEGALHPWFQVFRKFPSGHEEVLVDFIRHPVNANDMASLANMGIGLA